MLYISSALSEQRRFREDNESLRLACSNNNVLWLKTRNSSEGCIVTLQRRKEVQKRSPQRFPVLADMEDL